MYFYFANAEIGFKILKKNCSAIECFVIPTHYVLKM